MKKPILISSILGFMAVNVFAAAIQEHNGENYIVSILGGSYAVAYANRININEEFDFNFDPAIHDNKLNFIGVIAPLNPNEVLRRGFIQNGDKFLLSNDFPNILATYIGVRRSTNNTFIERDERNCWGIGYSIYGGEIYIIELILTQEEYEHLN
jgi:hypothetical protein